MGVKLAGSGKEPFLNFQDQYLGSRKFRLSRISRMSSISKIIRCERQRHIKHFF